MSARRRLRGWLSEFGYAMAASACLMAGVPWPPRDWVSGPWPEQRVTPVPPAPGHPERLTPGARPDPAERWLWDQLGKGFGRQLDQL